MARATRGVSGTAREQTVARGGVTGGVPTKVGLPSGAQAGAGGRIGQEKGGGAFSRCRPRAKVCLCADDGKAALCSGAATAGCGASGAASEAAPTRAPTIST